MDDKVLEDAAGAKKNTPIDSNDIYIIYIIVFKFKLYNIMYTWPLTLG